MLMQFCRRKLKLVTEKTKLNKNVILTTKWLNFFSGGIEIKTLETQTQVLHSVGRLGLSVQKFLKIFQNYFWV